MLLKLCLAIARASYVLVVIAIGGMGAFLGFLAATDSFQSLSAWASTAIFAAVFLFLGGHAVVRRLRGAELIPPSTDPGQWALVFFMTVAGSFGHFLAGIVLFAYYQINYGNLVGDVEGGPMVFVSAIAAAVYLVALLMGEFWLRHDEKPGVQTG